MNKTHAFVFLTFCILLLSCRKQNDIEFLGSFIDNNKQLDKCPDGYYIGVILRSNLNYTVYFYRFESDILGIEQTKTYDSNNIIHSAVGDGFNKFKFDLPLDGLSTDTFYICTFINKKIVKREYTLEYLNKNNVCRIVVFR